MAIPNADLRDWSNAPRCADVDDDDDETREESRERCAAAVLADVRLVKEVTIPKAYVAGRDDTTMAAVAVAAAAAVALR